MKKKSTKIFTPTCQRFPRRRTINPYRTAFNAVWHRLIWDIHPFSWKSRRRIRKWKDRYSGQKALILCNGPSLNCVDFELLKKSDVFSFGLNKINLLFSRTDYRPDAIVAINPFVIEQNSPFFNETGIPIFVNATGHRIIEDRENVHFLHTATDGRFARDCSVSVIIGATVTYVALQLAFHMGFTQVALAGCDHSFQTHGPANKLVTASAVDPNHFDPSYFSNGQQWQLPDLIGSEYHYQTARDYFENHGRKVLNCTDGGALHIFDRMRLEHFINAS